jgi:hypothetical protein
VFNAFTPQLPSNQASQRRPSQSHSRSPLAAEKRHTPRSPIIVASWSTQDCISRHRLVPSSTCAPSANETLTRNNRAARARSGVTVTWCSVTNTKIVH